MSDPFEKWVNRGRIEVDIQEATEYVREVSNILMRSGAAWGNEDVLKALEKKYGGENIALVGLAKIVKGDKPTVAMNLYQMNVIEAIGDFFSLSASRGSIYVTAENSKGDGESARLQHISAHIPKGRIVISKGLAEKLHLGDDDTLKISFQGQDLSELNLDGNNF